MSRSTSRGFSHILTVVFITLCCSIGLNAITPLKTTSYRTLHLHPQSSHVTADSLNQKHSNTMEQKVKLRKRLLESVRSVLDKRSPRETPSKRFHQYLTMTRDIYPSRRSYDKPARSHVTKDSNLVPVIDHFAGVKTWSVPYTPLETSTTTETVPVIEKLNDPTTVNPVTTELPEDAAKELREKAKSDLFDRTYMANSEIDELTPQIDSLHNIPDPPGHFADPPFSLNTWNGNSRSSVDSVNSRFEFYKTDPLSRSYDPTSISGFKDDVQRSHFYKADPRTSSYFTNPRSGFRDSSFSAQIPRSKLRDAVSKSGFKDPIPRSNTYYTDPRSGFIDDITRSGLSDRYPRPETENVQTASGRRRDYSNFGQFKAISPGEMLGSNLDFAIPDASSFGKFIPYKSKSGDPFTTFTSAEAGWGRAKNRDLDLVAGDDVDADVIRPTGTFQSEGSFTSDQNDCATIQSRVCHSNAECSCYGLYECAEGVCKIKSAYNKPISSDSSRDVKPKEFWHSGPYSQEELGVSQ